VIVKLFRSGRSFAKLAAYLLHDPDKATTKERVAWTHTLNLASDDPALAVDEMLWTYRGADWLKERAGVRAGGRPLEFPVKHFSLNWHPSEKPSREQMIKAVEDFLHSFGWQDHQALITRHDDKQHHHVHVMLNAVHPETGRALNASFERRWAQRWALDYERQNGRIFCEERLKPEEERAASPNRDMWMRMKASEVKNDRAEYERITKDFDFFTRKDPQNHKDYEWEVLKAAQKKERIEHFMQGKQEFKSLRNFLFNEVRTEFRDEWRDLYAAKRKGLDAKTFADRKTKLVAEQKTVLDKRRNDACATHQNKRDHTYRILRIRQKDEIEALKERQSHGLTTFAPYEKLARQDEVGPKHREAKLGISLKSETAREFGRAKEEVAKRDRRVATRTSTTRSTSSPTLSGPRNAARENARSGKGMDSLGLGVLGALSSLAEKLADGFLGGGEQLKPEIKPSKRARQETEREEIAAEIASAQAARDVAESEAERLHAFWHERRGRRRQRD
jgi:hypothetical protein